MKLLTRVICRYYSKAFWDTSMLPLPYCDGYFDMHRRWAIRLNSNATVYPRDLNEDLTKPPEFLDRVSA